jgi:hypothetical protein
MTDEAERHDSPDLSAIVRRLRLESAADHAALQRMSALLDDPALQVHERDVPVDATTLMTAAPDWGRGGALASTVGPFTRTDGRPVWFDFLRLTRLVPVFLAGDAQPAVLFSVRELPLRLGDPVPVLDVLRLLQRRYTLGPGSVWIRADLLAAGAPPGSYVGLLITEGHVTFRPPPMDAGGRLTMPAGGRCALELTFDQPAVAATFVTAGKDAADAILQVPATATFVLGGQHADETRVADAHWQLFGQAVDFRWDNVAARYEPDLHAVLVPMTASVTELEPSSVESPLADITGAAPIDRAGWLLPVATIDVTKPPVAGGAGGLAVLGGDGLFITWTGLQDGPARLPSPWFVLLPGVAGVLDRQADNIYAHQRFELWADAQSRFRSELELRWSDSFPVTFVSAASGADVVVTTAAVDARLDRPVDVRGTPLPIHTLGSRLNLAVTEVPGAEPYRTVAIRDDDVLNDALQLAATSSVEAGGSMSLAIRNALFTTTPVATFTLSGHMLDPEVVDYGTVTLGFGLYGLLPTLPDPYAANVGWLLAGPYSRRVASVAELLLAAVNWTRGADADDVATGFSFAPVGNLADMFQRWGLARAHPVAGRPSRDMTFSIAAPAAATDDPADAPAMAFVAGRQSADATWHAYFDAFEREQFALLDVSSNADQMGVSFAWQSPREAGDRSRGAREFLTADTEAGADDFPLQVRDLDLSAKSRFVRAFTVPQISWEPLANLTPPDTSVDPPFGFLLFPDDGGPTRLFNDAATVVPIAPIPVMKHLESDFHERPDGFTGGLFTLPFGLRAAAEFSRTNQLPSRPGTGAKLAFNAERFSDGALVGGLQLRVDAPENLPESAIFKGATVQLSNLLTPGGTPTGTGALGDSVGEVFNNEFFLEPPGDPVHDRGVPVTRIDFSGYGASLFSRWDNPNAVVAATSQAHFDVFVGRTAHEVIQIRSLLYPWGVHVVRTITMFRGSNGYTFRYDSGWQAESPGVFDFRYKAYDVGYPRPELSMPSPFVFHPGLVHGVFNVRNIHETQAVPEFTDTWIKNDGDTYLDPNSVLHVVGSGTPPADRTRSVHLRPVYFDADVEIEGVTTGASGGRVPSKGMLGYVQLAPRGEPINAALFTKLLVSQFGSIGGSVDCGIDVAASGQPMRISRVDVSPSTDGAGGPIFVGSARGAVTLPKDGSWSVVQHDQGTGEVTPLDPQVPVPVVRRGVLNVATATTDTTAADLVRLANPVDLVAALTPTSRNFGLLQSTGTQKALFRLPAFSQGVDTLKSVAPDFADAYRIVNSTSVFPNVADALPLALGGFETKIIKEGYKLVDAVDPDKIFEQVLPRGPLFLINESFLKLYVEYAPTDKNGAPLGAGTVKYGFDSAAAATADKWLAKVNDIGMVVDLGPMQRVMTIRGKFDAANGSQPGFIEPELVFSDALQPVIDILQVLLAISTGDYADAMKKGLDVAMSNGADSWNYALHARQEIPVVKFPPEPLYSTSAVNPFKLEAHLAIGVYFNETMEIPSSPKQLVPSAGAFLQFGGSLSVMCVSLAAATVYATGSVDLITAADIKTGPALHMKFGFGCELVVGLPVVGGVTVTYMVGVQIDLDTGSITVGGFLLFRGRAELLGGLVSAQIQIEAKGSVKRDFGSDSTEMIAQVTFGLDISIFLVINISFSQSWQESRQIA